MIQRPYHTVYSLAMAVERTFEKTVVKTLTVNGKTTTVKVTVEVSGGDPATAKKLMDEAKADMQKSLDSSMKGARASFDEALSGFEKSMKDFFKGL